MKNKLHLTLLLISILCYSTSFAQEMTYYLPGSGTTVKELDFEAASQLTETFDYCNGWAGTGFGLSGTQRGAPEKVSVIENPQSVTSSGNQVLAFRSYERDAAWHAEHSADCPSSIYGGADDNTLGGGTQDDFFMYSDDWVVADAPSVMMHVFVPSYSDDNRIVTSLRMPVQFIDVDDEAGTQYNSWPGIWCYGDEFSFRGPGRADIFDASNAPNGGKNTWWTFGLSITPDGDIQYYATPTYVTELTSEHFLYSNSGISAAVLDAGWDPEMYGYYPVAQNSDAIIMSSNVNMSEELTLIDNLLYTKGTTEVLSVSKHETVSIKLFPNPTSNYFYIKGLNTETSYKIFDSLGRAIDNGSISSSADEINVNALSKGIYFLELEGYNTKRFIKN